MKPHNPTLLFVIVAIAGTFLSAGCGTTPKIRFVTTESLTPGIFLEEERIVLPAGVEARKVSDKGLELTKESEGFRGMPYNDAAHYCTIGYGHLIHLEPCDATIPENFFDGITRPEGTELLRDDMHVAERGVTGLVDRELTGGQYGALCDFVFNVGVGNFRKSTLRKRVNAGEYNLVPFEFRRWVYAGGKKLKGLAIRREKEIELFFDEEEGVPRLVPPPGLDLTPIDIRTGEAEPQ